MFVRILLLFTLVPFVELVILLKLSDWHGWLVTVWLILITGLIGTFFARQQGFEVWRKLQRELREGKPPTGTLTEGLLVLIAGAFLITPGVLTDACGFLLLWPWFRRQVSRIVGQRMLKNARFTQAGGASFFQFDQFDKSRFEPADRDRQNVPPRPRFDANGQEIIDVEFTRKDSAD